MSPFYEENVNFGIIACNANENISMGKHEKPRHKDGQMYKEELANFTAGLMMEDEQLKYIQIARGRIFLQLRHVVGTLNLQFNSGFDFVCSHCLQQINIFNLYEPVLLFHNFSKYDNASW